MSENQVIRPIDPPRYATCSACGEQALCTQQDHYPDDGWVLPFDTFGYYGGFDDNIDVLLGGRISREWIFCHDCVVKLLNTFPRLAESVGPNCHSCDSDTPCCVHSWQATESFAVDDGQPDIRTAWPDGAWRDHYPQPSAYDESSTEHQEESA